MAEMRLSMLKGLKPNGTGLGDLSSAFPSSSSLNRSTSKSKKSSGGGGDDESVGGASSSGGGTKGIAPKTIPEELLPDLALMLVRGGPDGVTKIVNEFHLKHTKEGVRSSSTHPEGVRAFPPSHPPTYP